MPAPKPNQVMPTLRVQDETNQNVEARLVSLALVKYRQPGDMDDTIQLAVIGSNNVQLLDSRAIGFSDRPTPKGIASKWLADLIFAALKAGAK